MSLSRSPRKTAGRRSGFALVEVMVSAMILTVCGFMMSATITATMTHRVVRQETAAAADVARNVLEEMRSAPFRDLFALYNECTTDDPEGEGTAPGLHFDVPGLDPLEDDADGHVGIILLPGSGPELRESLAAGTSLPGGSSPTELDLPRDLNGDGVVDEGDHAHDYFILPIQVLVEWKGYNGSRQLRLNTLMTGINRQ